MAIKPVDLPSAAGLNFGSSDVRHFSEGDALDVPGMSNPTRYLAQRDNTLAEKLNEAIQVINNNEQIVPLPFPRTVIPPNAEEVVTNWRIPGGFEARVLNAAVGSSPVSSAVELNVYFALGFGGTSGSAIVTTSSESQPQTSFQQNGELIVTLKNKGSVTLEVVGSVLLTMRPIGGQGGLLVGTVIQGQPGPPGMQGGQGQQGTPGTGGAGTPGMVWTGGWSLGRNYSPPQVASFAQFGTVTSSYIVKVSHLSDSTNQPPNPAFWDLVAQGSSGSVVGAKGDSGSPGLAGTSPQFSFAVLNGTFTAGSDFSSEAGVLDESGYSAGPAPGTSANMTFQECFVGTNAGTPKGAAFLFGNFRSKFCGHGTVTLPSVVNNGAKVDYNNVVVQCTVSVQGTGALAALVKPVSSNAYSVFVTRGTNMPVNLAVYGVQQFG